MKKFFAFGIVLLFVCTMSFTAFSAGVPVAPTGEIVPDASSLTGEELRQREDVYNEILALSKEDENITAVEFSKDGSWWIFVEISVEDDYSYESMHKIKEYGKKFNEQYGSFVIVTDNIKDTQEGTLTGERGLGDNNKPGNPFSNPWLWSVCVLLLSTATGILFIKLIRYVPAAQTASGNIISKNAAVSKKEIISALKQNQAAPADTVFDSILQRIEKSE